MYCRLGIVRQDVCHVLHGAGVNLEQFPLTPYPTDGTVTRFLFIGRVMREKGVDELFAAMRSLRAAGQSCVLHVVGDTEEDYRARLHEGEEAGWLVYHGYQTDVHPFIAEAHCLVLPSYHEGMANVNLESASMGRPLITSRIPGCMEAVREGENRLPVCTAGYRQPAGRHAAFPAPVARGTRGDGACGAGTYGGGI